MITPVKATNNRFQIKIKGVIIMKKTVIKRFIAGILTTVTALSVGTAVTTTVGAATVDDAKVGGSVSDYWADLGRSGMENAIKNMFGEVPVVGEIFAGPLSNLMADQLGFGELSTNDISKQISDLSYHLDIRFDELDKKLSDIDKDVKHVEAKLDENTEKIISEMYQSNTLSTYNGYYQDLSTDFKVINTKFSSIDDPAYNDDEKLVELAIAMGTEDRWSDATHAVKNLINVGDCLAGTSKISSKGLFNMVYESNAKDDLFAKAPIEKTDAIMADVMREYLSYYTLVMSSLKAQEAIAAQSEGRTTELPLAKINPDNLNLEVIKKDYSKLIENNHYYNIVNMENQLSETCAAVFKQCEKINSLDPKTFIDHGNENRVLTMHHYDMVNFGYWALSYDSFFKNNYTVSPAQINEICTAARANGMNVAEYLDSVGYTETYQFNSSGQYYVLASETPHRFSIGASSFIYFTSVDTADSWCIIRDYSPVRTSQYSSDLCMKDVLTF